MDKCERHKNIEIPKCPICLTEELLLHYLIRDRLQKENEELRQEIKDWEDWAKNYF